MNGQTNGGPGRPKTDNPKVHLPRVRIYEDTVIRLEKISKEKGRSKSDIYQEALDLYLRVEEKRHLSVTL